MVNIFLICPRKHMLWGYSLEAPQQGTFNEYHNVWFHGEIRKRSILLDWKKHLICFNEELEKVSSYIIIIIDLDKSVYQVNIFLIFPWKRILWVLIRSASVRCFLCVPQNTFSWRNKKIMKAFGLKKSILSRAKCNVIVLQSIGINPESAKHCIVADVILKSLLLLLLFF